MTATHIVCIKEGSSVIASILHRRCGLWSSCIPKGHTQRCSCLPPHECSCWCGSCLHRGVNFFRCQSLGLDWGCESQHDHCTTPGPRSTHIFYHLDTTGDVGHNMGPSAPSEGRELLSLLALWAAWVGGVNHLLGFCLPPGTEVLTSFWSNPIRF